MVIEATRWIQRGKLGLMTLLTAGLAVAGSAEPVRVERVALFKNGLGYFQAAASLPRGETMVRFGQLPVPVHGTFWVTYPKDVKVRGLFTRMEEVEQIRPVTSKAELLRANVGRWVAVTTSYDEAGEPPLRGRILEVPAPARPGDPNPYAMDVETAPPDHHFSEYQSAPLVLLETEAGTVALSTGSVLRVHFEGEAGGEDGEDLVTTLPWMTRRPSLRMELEKPAQGQKIGINFLASGITWAPSYQIDLSDPETARLTAKAVVVNEVADLDGVHLDLVTGFPNVAFANVRSPMAMSQDLSEFLSSLASRGSRRGAGMLGQQAVMYNQANFAPVVAMPRMDDSTPAGARAAEDLFFYPLDDVRLARGETAVLPLFTTEMPYEHIYTWDVEDKLDEDERYQRDDDAKRDTEEVWHACRLINTLTMPLTTAPAQFVTHGQLTGQDIAYYTAPGAETTIRINRALNVVAEDLELELGRQPDEERIRGNRYQRVEIQGELKLVNRAGKRVRVEVTKELTGEVSETTPTARDLSIARGLKGVNPRHQLVWEVDLDGGAAQTLSYVYKVYVRN